MVDGSVRTNAIATCAQSHSCDKNGLPGVASIRGFELVTRQAQYFTSQRTDVCRYHRLSPEELDLPRNNFLGEGLGSARWAVSIYVAGDKVKKRLTSSAVALNFSL